MLVVTEGRATLLKVSQDLTPHRVEKRMSVSTLNFFLNSTYKGRREEKKLQLANGSRASSEVKSKS